MFRKTIANFQPTIVHSHDNLGYYVLRLETPHIITSHSNWPRSWFIDTAHFLAGLALELPQDLLQRAADSVVSVSEYSKKQLARRGISSTRIYNGVRLPEIKHQQESGTFLFVGTVGNRKAKHLPQIWKDVLGARNGRDVHLNVVGKAGNEEITEALRELPATTVHGPVDNIEPHYKQADILLFPSRAEACPLTLLEAMSYGLPSVAFDICSHREIIDNRETGHLVEAYDTRAFATAALQLAATDLRRAFRRCRARIESAFSQARMVEQYTELYQEQGA